MIGPNHQVQEQCDGDDDDRNIYNNNDNNNKWSDLVIT